MKNDAGERDDDDDKTMTMVIKKKIGSPNSIDSNFIMIIGSSLLLLWQQLWQQPY